MLLSKEICDQFSDEDLVGRTLQDVDYLACIYQRYEKRLLHFIHRMSSLSEEESRDVLQDAFIKIWKNLNAYDPSVKLSSWIYRIVRNETISQWRRKTDYGKVRIIPISDAMRSVLPEMLDAEKLSEDGAQALRRLVDGIPGKYRDVLILRYFEKMNYDEMSDILKIPEGTVATRLNRGKKIIRERMRERMVDFESN